MDGALFSVNVLITFSIGVHDLVQVMGSFYVRFLYIDVQIHDAGLISVFSQSAVLNRSFVVFSLCGNMSLCVCNLLGREDSKNWWGLRT